MELIKEDSSFSRFAILACRSLLNLSNALEVRSFCKERSSNFVWKLKGDSCVDGDGTICVVDGVTGENDLLLLDNVDNDAGEVREVVDIYCGDGGFKVEVVIDEYVG